MPESSECSMGLSVRNSIHSHVAHMNTVLWTFLQFGFLFIFLNKRLGTTKQTGLPAENFFFLFKKLTGTHSEDENGLKLRAWPASAS